MSYLYPERPSGASPNQSPRLQFPRDIRLADVLAEHQRTKHRKAPARPQPAPTREPADDWGLAEWRQRYWLGGDVEGFEYQARWRKGVLHMTRLHRPNMGPVVRWFAESWPAIKNIVVRSGDEHVVTYSRTYPGDDDGLDIEGAGWWRAVRPDQADCVY